MRRVRESITNHARRVRESITNHTRRVRESITDLIIDYYAIDIYNLELWLARKCGGDCIIGYFESKFFGGWFD